MFFIDDLFSSYFFRAIDSRFRFSDQCSSFGAMGGGGAQNDHPAAGGWPGGPAAAGLIKGPSTGGFKPR